MRRTTTSKMFLASTILLAGTLTGCTNNTPDNRSSATPAVTSTPLYSAEGLPPGAVGATEIPTDVPNDPKARKNVSTTSCTATDDGWTMTGTIANTTKNDTSYTLTVFFTTATATILATTTTVVDVPAGEIRYWDGTAAFAAPDGTKCVLRGVAAS
ncbi:hypothetical protein ITJ57_18915 [Plantibacter sp. VKM Ac-2880]|uniref:hypothetical protein n=1 Tax=Plantibacter sp. VKM Ac-2880 TaxID=2783827 RepID=UPI00188FDAC0|nr:hypothetical protein [Plantibacter sp. VKM Ac-2880]MBF4570846.1 hypothetical protein [Plantibacter sp. VKM Ac-2880]